MVLLARNTEWKSCKSAWKWATKFGNVRDKNTCEKYIDDHSRSKYHSVSNTLLTHGNDNELWALHYNITFYEMSDWREMGFLSQYIMSNTNKIKVIELVKKCSMYVIIQSIIVQINKTQKNVNFSLTLWVSCDFYFYDHQVNDGLENKGITYHVCVCCLLACTCV